MPSTCAACACSSDLIVCWLSASCSWHGVVAVRLTSARPGSQTSLSKTSTFTLDFVKRIKNVGGGADNCQVLWSCSAQSYRYSVTHRNKFFWALRRQAANMRLLVRAVSVRMEQLGSRRFGETGCLHLHVFKVHEDDSLFESSDHH